MRNWYINEVGSPTIANQPAFLVPNSRPNPGQHVVCDIYNQPPRFTMPELAFLTVFTTFPSEREMIKAVREGKPGWSPKWPNA